MTPALTLFSDYRTPSSSGAWRPGPAQATLIGSSSVFLWAVWPSLAVFSFPTPAFQTLAIGMAVGFLCLAGLRVLRGENLGGMVPRSPGLLAAGVIGILGTNAFNFIAITRIPPAQASAIAYLWPMMAIILTKALGLKPLEFRQGIAVLLGLVGAVLVINPFGSIRFDFIGIGCALLAGLSWAGYTIYRMVDHRGAPDAVGVYSLIAAMVCLVLHAQFEETRSMSAVQLGAIVALGIAPMGLANAAWDYGVSRGDARTLSILAYGTPLVATLLLVVLGLAAVTPSFLMGAALIVGAAAIGTWPARGN
jgi:drug/metabolite transporter (DMT)-like permease